jgi:DNA-binding transcriptional regulator YiaG
MISHLCAATAVALAPVPMVTAPNDWDAASRYDTVLPLLQLLPYQATFDQGGMFISSSIARQLGHLSAVCRGTSAGFDLLVFEKSQEISVSASELVRDLKALSGLTWEKIADLLEVSARTVHNWSAGLPIAEKKHHRLSELVAVVRFIDRGFGELNRELLLGNSVNGKTLFALLVAEDFEAVKTYLGAGPGRAKPASALPAGALKFSAPDQFGATLLLAERDDPSQILPVSTPGKRAANPRHKGS